MKYLSFKLSSIFIILLFVLVVMGTIFPSLVLSAEWRVIPIRLDFSAQTKSGVVSVVNSGDETLYVSVFAKEWLQDGFGKDQYSDAADLIFFPKQLKIDPGSKRVVRVGIKTPAIKQEKAYRLYVREEKAPTNNSSQVAVALRVGIPIFVKPLEEKIAGEIADIKVSDGEIYFSVRNRGNAHFRTTHIEVFGKDVAGQQVFNQELKGWYLLAGADQQYSALIPLKIRSQLANIDVKVVTDRMELFGSTQFKGIVDISPQSE